MKFKKNICHLNNLIVVALTLPLLVACSTAYYGAMEKVGVHKRDILADRVVASRDAQTEAQEQFKSALEQFESVVQLKNTDLKKAYDRLNSEYEDSEKAADEVTDRIEKVESVADALFDEWQDELELYQNRDLRRASKEQLNDTKSRYKEMLSAMRRAEKSMKPVLRTFRDNVLFLKHNLNAQAIGSLKGEFTKLEEKIGQLIGEMNRSIASSDQFIADLKK